MAKFFTGKGENNSLQRVVEIQDMDAAVFKAMLRFIYTDEAPELDVKLDAAAMTFAQHLLIATGRYGLDRLKVMCERTIALGMDASTVASTFALAEQRNFPRLKAKCINFIAEGSLENLDAMLATEGYKNLFASSPMVLTELLKATHARKSTSNHNGWLQHLFRSTQTVTVRTMRHTSTQLTECVQSVHLLTINGFSVTKAAIGNNTRARLERTSRSACVATGESFAAHKNILAARSPVFKAGFFGEMEEKTSQCVEIQDMEAQVFKAMLRFIYTDMVPDEFDNQPEAVAGTVMAQHLLVAADRFGLDRLKLRTKCIEFINRGSPENLDAVTATEGYRHLEESNSFVLCELLKVLTEILSSKRGRPGNRVSPPNHEQSQKFQHQETMKKTKTFLHSKVA
nr:unnamed protein product [Digitaria exilis]